ncbi:MAG: hypothetical protein HFG27_08570 [Provencibacterium sp.]|nr:hypothetical protein [Provencibacterium sp.]
MARTKTVTVNKQDYTLQSVSPSWYLQNSDRHRMTGSGTKDTAGYMDELIKNCVIEPAEVRQKGIAFFDDAEDLVSLTELVGAIETFLKSRE